MAKPLVDRSGLTGAGTRLQRARLWSGLILFGYVTLHYINHSLGHVSLAAMEEMLEWMGWVVASLPGQIILYGALLTHVTLALGKLAGMRTWRRPVWEWTQIALGLAIPWFLFSHLTYTRGAETLLGVEVDYAQELALLWPSVWLQQSALLLIVWIHGCIGIHYWLRLRPWYPRHFALLAGIGVLIPALGLTGWIVAARREFDKLLQLAEAAAANPGASPAPAGSAGQVQVMLQSLGRLEDMTQWLAIGVALGVIAIMVARWGIQRFRTRIKITYGDGTVVQSTAGLTLLEVSRAWGIPHMSVCGGRARCSTCRTLIVDGRNNLTPQTEAEQLLLQKLNADPGIRLACQARVLGNVSIRPLIQPQGAAGVVRNADPLGWGVEREIAVLFLDIRGFSRISEKSLPYDIVFILNSLFAEVGSAIESNNGYIDKFMGDGMMALFGLASTPADASRDALRAAIAAQEATAHAGRMLTQHINEPLRIGIGIHTGNAVIGRIGKTSDQVTPSRLTAIGDTVNVAARLEAATKELKCGIVVSSVTLKTAGIGDAGDFGEQSEINVHNISQPVDVVAIKDMKQLSRRLGLLEESGTPKSSGFSMFSGLAGNLASLAKKTGRN